jgi:hypothetical protein
VPANDLPAYITLTEAAIALGISRQRVHQLVMDGKLSALPTSVGRVIARTSLETEQARRSTPTVRAAIAAAHAERRARIDAEVDRLGVSGAV